MNTPNLKSANALGMVHIKELKSELSRMWPVVEAAEALQKHEKWLTTEVCIQSGLIPHEGNDLASALAAMKEGK